MKRNLSSASSVVIYSLKSLFEPKFYDIRKKMYIIRFIDKHEEQGYEYRQFSDDFESKKFLKAQRQKYILREQVERDKKKIAQLSQMEIYQLLGQVQFKQFLTSTPLKEPVPKAIDCHIPFKENLKNKLEPFVSCSVVSNSKVYFQREFSKNKLSKRKLTVYHRPLSWMLLDCYLNKIESVNVISNFDYSSAEEYFYKTQSFLQNNFSNQYYHLVKALETKFKQVTYQLLDQIQKKPKEKKIAKKQKSQDTDKEKLKVKSDSEMEKEQKIVKKQKIPKAEKVPKQRKSESKEKSQFPQSNTTESSEKDKN